MHHVIVLISLLWTYDHTEISRKLSDSLDTPILAAFVLPKGSVSQKINHTFSILSEILDPFINVIYTVVDCSYSRFCLTHGIGHYPTICLLRTFSRKYWKCTDETDISGVSNFLKYELTPNIKTSSFYSSEIREKLLSGGTLFSLSANDQSDRTFEAVKRAAIKYKPYDVLFLLSTSYYDGKSITAHFSTKCQTSASLQSIYIDEFVRFNSFSVYHQYTYEEFNSGGNYIIYAGYENRFRDKNKMIDQIVELVPCDFPGKIGFASLSSERWIAEITGKYNSIDPFVVGINVDKKCFIHIKNISQLNDSEFYIDLMVCEKSKKILPRSPYKGIRNDAMFLVFLGIIVISSFILLIFNMKFNSRSTRKNK